MNVLVLQKYLGVMCHGFCNLLSDDSENTGYTRREKLMWQNVLFFQLFSKFGNVPKIGSRKKGLAEYRNV